MELSPSTLLFPLFPTLGLPALLLLHFSYPPPFFFLEKGREREGEGEEGGKKYGDECSRRRRKLLAEEFSSANNSTGAIKDSSYIAETEKYPLLGHLTSCVINLNPRWKRRTRRRRRRRRRKTGIEDPLPGRQKEMTDMSGIMSISPSRPCPPLTEKKQEHSLVIPPPPPLNLLPTTTIRTLPLQCDGGDSLGLAAVAPFKIK